MVIVKYPNQALQQWEPKYSVRETLGRCEELLGEKDKTIIHAEATTDISDLKETIDGLD